MSRAPLPLRADERLIFALDVPDRVQALEWVDRLGDSVAFYKIGMELLASGEYFQVLDELARRDKRVFVDLKFFDIPATAAAMASINFPTSLAWPTAVFEIIGGMMIMSVIIGLPAHFTSQSFTRTNLAIRTLSGMFSLGFGAWLVYEIGFVEGLLR